jgi:hypothetical protein
MPQIVKRDVIRRWKWPGFWATAPTAVPFRILTHQINRPLNFPTNRPPMSGLPCFGMPDAHGSPLLGYHRVGLPAVFFLWCSRGRTPETHLHTREWTRICVYA